MSTVVDVKVETVLSQLQLQYVRVQVHPRMNHIPDDTRHISIIKSITSYILLVLIFLKHIRVGGCLCEFPLRADPPGFNSESALVESANS